MIKSASVILLFTAFSLASCSGNKDTASDKPTIAVSIEPQRQLLEQLAGDRFDVVTLLSRGSDPETYDPSMSVRRLADKSEAYFAISAFPFEGKIRESLPERVVYADVSEGIVPIFGTHGHAHAHNEDEESDPHVWTSIANMKTMAANMVKTLCSIDSGGATIYKEREAALSRHLDSLDISIRKKMPAKTVFAIWHPSLSYFARDYDLKQIAVGYESKEMPAKKLKDVIDSARNENVRILFFQKEYDNRQAENINEAIGSRFVEIDPLAYEWEAELIKISDALSRP